MKYTWMIVLIFGLSCQPSYDFSFNDIPPKLVLWGYIHSDSTIKVQLGRTFEPLANPSPKERYIEYATLILFENDMPIDTLTDKGEGVYEADASIFPKIGNVYHIVAIKEGFRTIESLPDTIPPYPLITSYMASDSVRPLHGLETGKIRSEHQIQVFFDPSFKEQTYIGQEVTVTKTDGTVVVDFWIKNLGECSETKEAYIEGGAYIATACIENPLTLTTTNYKKGDVEKLEVKICHVAASAYPFHIQLSNLQIPNMNFIEVLPTPSYLGIETMKNGYGYFGGYNCKYFEVKF